MRKTIKNSPLSGINKKITNHSAMKILVKTLKRNETPKFKIISITRHNTEVGLDAYDSGDKDQLKLFSFPINNHKP